MQYFGGKQRIARKLVPFLNEQIGAGQHFYDLFCGSGNIVSQIRCDAVKHANDIRDFMISLLSTDIETLKSLPDFVTEEDYRRAREEVPTSDPLHAFILVGCSFAGKYKGGYARAKNRSYAASAKKSLLKKAKGLSDIKWSCKSYNQVEIKPDSVVYCDIPYHNVVGYGTNFNHDNFYRWVSQQNSTVFISEYEGSYNPLNLPTVWSQESKQDIRSKGGKREATLEILRKFTP